MSNSQRRMCGAIATVFMLGGCASLPLEQGRSNVQTLVQSRATVGLAADQPTALSLTEPLTLEKAQQIAMLRNPSLKANYSRLGLSAADVFEAGRLQNPSLGVSWLLPTGVAEGSKLGASLMASFADLLLRSSRQRIAAAEFTVLQEQIASATLDILSATQLAWFDCVAANQRVAARRSISEAARLAADLAQQYREAGNVSSLELQMQRAEASQAQIALQDAQMQLTDARAELQKLLGLSAAESAWTVPETLPEVPQSAAIAPQSVFTRALDQRLDILAARRHVQALGQQVIATRRYRALADSRAGVALEREADGTKRIGPSLELALPLFQQGQGAVARSQAGLGEAQAALAELEVSAQAELVRHWSRRELAREQVKAYREGLIPEREAVVARISERANFMLVDSFAVLMARQQEYAAYAGYVDAQQKFWNAHVEVLHALGSQRSVEELR